MKEILLIGNGPSAAKHTMGKAIDSFPCVARFNTFRIHGYKEYVGSKCDIWFACDNFPQWQRLYDYKEVYLPGSRQTCRMLNCSLPGYGMTSVQR